MTQPSIDRQSGGLIRAMVARDPHEQHRAATTLELLFDLCFVVAIAQAAGQLHHSIGHGEIGHGVTGYLMTFFAVWWAWMNFTWFASAFDTDDVPYRLKVLVQMIGALVIAAGVESAFKSGDFRMIVAGYIVMRLGLVGLWLRAAKDAPELRVTALRYAGGVTAMQLLWIARIWFPAELAVPSFVLFVIGELLVPVWAERARMTPWHPEHIAERYGLMTIIVIGESVLASVLAVQAMLDGGHKPGLQTWSVVAAAPVILFSMWWLYFLVPGERVVCGATIRRAIFWGYGHFSIFVAAAAVGAALALSVDFASGHTSVSTLAMGMALAIPSAIYVAAIRIFVLGPSGSSRKLCRTFEVAILLLVASAFFPSVPLAVALLLAGTVAAAESARERTPRDQLETRQAVM